MHIMPFFIDGSNRPQLSIERNCMIAYTTRFTGQSPLLLGKPAIVSAISTQNKYSLIYGMESFGP